MDEQSAAIVYPRILAQTEMISRGVVEVHDHRVFVSDAPKASGKMGKPQPENITAEQFYDAMGDIQPNLPDRLRKLVSALEPLALQLRFLPHMSLLR